MKKRFAFAMILCLAAPAFASGEAKVPAPQKWPFQGAFATYDRASLQRGFQVYREVCSACHGLTLLSFQDLAAPGGPGFGDAAMRNILASFTVPAGPNETGDEFDENGTRLMRAAKASDHIPAAFPNEQAARAANNGALPPDLSLIEKARAGGADYVYALMLGFEEKPPQGFKAQDVMFYNPYFAGWNIAMTPPLSDDAVSYADGTKATTAQEARDVATFLAWASDPKMEERHKIGFEVMAFLILFSGLMFLTTRKVWKDVG
jgi:ubiquinol-cytochrome c reductase cytochrome c1 subunit